MTPHDFSLWLHGFTELTGGAMPSEAQWKMIVEHLDLVFKKVTPPLQTPTPDNFNAIKLPVIRPGEAIAKQFKPRVISIEEAQAELRKAAKEIAERKAVEPQRRKTIDDLYDEHYAEVERKAKEARDAAEAERKKQEQIAREKKIARDVIDTPREPQGPNRFDDLMKKAFPDAAREQERKRQEEYYKDRTREVPFFPQIPQPIQFPPNAPVSPSPGYPWPYYTLAPNNTTLIC